MRQRELFESQPTPEARVSQLIHHGSPEELFTFLEENDVTVAFLQRSMEEYNASIAGDEWNKPFETVDEFVCHPGIRAKIAHANGLVRNGTCATLMEAFGFVRLALDRPMKRTMLEMLRTRQRAKFRQSLPPDASAN